MPIVGLVVALLIGAVLVWRVAAYIKAGKAVVDTADDLKALLRRHGWRHRSAPRPIEAIKDPMLMAAVILMLTIRCDRDVTQEDRGKLAGEMIRAFRIDRSMAEELVGEAEFLVRDVTDYPRWTSRLAARLVPLCTAEERNDVLAMAAVTGPAGEPSDRRMQVLASYREAARLG